MTTWRLVLSMLFLNGSVTAAFVLPEFIGIVAASLCAALSLLLVVTPCHVSTIVRFGRLRWTEQDLCRHVLVTGDTGSGKSTGAIHSLLLQITRNVANWGGLVLGIKGDEHRFIEQLTAATGRSNDLVHLAVRPDDAPPSWTPPHRYNLLSDRTLPWMSHAKAIVDTASSLTEGRQSAFFKPMAQLSLANAFELLDSLGRAVTISSACELLTSTERMQEAIDAAKARSEDCGSLEHFLESTFLNSEAEEQREGIQGTIKTYLGFFLDPDIREVFSSEEPDTFALSDVDRGTIITLSLPQRFVTERRYLNTYLKTLFYYHALRRLERPSQPNLLLLVADEFQDVVTATEDGMSDHRIVDRVRAARLAIIAGMQSEIAADPAIGKARREVLALNMRTRVIFRAADWDGAVASSRFIGERKVWKRRSTHKPWEAPIISRTQEDEAYCKPSKLLCLPDRVAIIVHPSKRWTKRRLPRVRLPDTL